MSFAVGIATPHPPGDGPGQAIDPDRSEPRTLVVRRLAPTKPTVAQHFVACKPEMDIGVQLDELAPARSRRTPLARNRSLTKRNGAPTAPIGLPMVSASHFVSGSPSVGSVLGTRVTRVDDAAFLTVGGRYVGRAWLLATARNRTAALVANSGYCPWSPKPAAGAARADPAERVIGHRAGRRQLDS